MMWSNDLTKFFQFSCGGSGYHSLEGDSRCLAGGTGGMVGLEPTLFGSAELFGSAQRCFQLI